MERKVHLVNKRPPKPKMLHVVGYARVSSGKDAMLHSLAAQIDYFQNLIKNHAGWEYCGVYADEAMTGTKEERPQFRKMLEKCRNHEVDLIITKSITTVLTVKRRHIHSRENWSATVAASTISVRKQQQVMFGFAVHSTVRESQPARQGRFQKQYLKSCQQKY